VAITDPNITFKKSFVQELYNYIEHLEKDLGSRNPKFSDELEKVLKDSVLNPLQLAKKLEGHDKILMCVNAKGTKRLKEGDFYRVKMLTSEGRLYSFFGATRYSYQTTKDFSKAYLVVIYDQERNTYLFCKAKRFKELKQ